MPRKIVSSRVDNLFPKHLFWDMDVATLDTTQDRDIIIPRALFATTAETFDRDITVLESIYPKIEIYRELGKTKERVSDKVCKLVSRRYKRKTISRFAR
jgi:hypothetical protein